jgi:hypothetical protein
MVFPLTMHYMVAQSRKPPPEKKQIPDSRVTQLLNTSWANRELHQEYRSYFLANHMFHVVGPNGAPYIDFFDQIGPIARASIADVVLDNSNFWSYNGLHYWMPYLAGLHTLNIYMHLGHLVHIDVYSLIRAYVLGDTIRCEEFWDPPVHNPGFYALPALQKLEINCAVPNCKMNIHAYRLRREKLNTHLCGVVL